MPDVLYSAISSTVSIDSLVASSMNVQLLTTMTSASPGSSLSSQPAWPMRASMASLSVRFLGQPRLTKWTLRPSPCSSDGIDGTAAEVG